MRWAGVRRQELALIVITMLWGATFLIVHIAMRHSGPMFFVGLRFTTAGLLSALIFWRVLRGIRWREIVAGASIGVAIFLGYGLQTAGLQTIDSSTSAFMTAFYVPLVPLLQWIIFRKAPRAWTIAGAGLAFAGLILVAGPTTGVALGQGEIFTLLSTLPMAAEIILISVFTARVSIGRLTVVQLLTAGLLGFVAMPIVGERVPAFSWVWVAAGVGLGAASCIIQLTMTWAQRQVSPTKATIIYAGEPVWAGIVGRLAGERMPVLAVVGAGLIVMGVLVSEIRTRRSRLDASAPDAPDAAPPRAPDPPPGHLYGAGEHIAGPA